MDAQNWLVILLLGGLLGMVGQGTRAIVGLKKASDLASASGQTLSDRFDGTQLGISLLIGFIAGALAVMGLALAGKLSETANLEGHVLMTVFTAGYAGTDFIEGFIRTESIAQPLSKDGLPDKLPNDTKTPKPLQPPQPPQPVPVPVPVPAPVPVPRND